MNCSAGKRKEYNTCTNTYKIGIKLNITILNEKKSMSKDIYLISCTKSIAHR